MPPLIEKESWLLYIQASILAIIMLIQLRAKLRQTWNWIKFKLRKGLIEITIGTTTFLQRIERKLSRNLKTREDELYEELTPLDNADQDKVYDQQLKWALGKTNIRNIAITGTYGSGKSSVIKTFQKNHREYRYLNISLASFPENVPQVNADSVMVKSKEGKSGIVLDAQLVEFSILQQIILHIHHNRLPGSRFHRIRHQKRWKTFLLALSLSIFLFTGAYLFNKKFFDRFIELLSWEDKNSWLNILPWLFIGGFIFLSYSLLRIYANSIISKVKIPAAEVELESKETSVLNRQIEEILYFFEVTSYDVVIIEDLDRFGDPDIFTKLREINLLINNAEQVKRNVVFLYVLGDHVFKGESRTKFFDYIVPVIPVVNSSNAYQLLTDRIKKANLAESLPDQFIDEVSLYINDMRLLKNIMNEFNLYYAKLKKDKISSLNDTYLFSLIVYKNLYPEDFALLQTGRGVIVKEFERKLEYVHFLAENMKKRSEDLQQLIDREQGILQNSVEELRTIYLTKWLDLERNTAVSFLLDSISYSVNQLVKDDLFEKIRKKRSTRYNYSSSSYNFSWEEAKNNFDAAEKIIDPATTYDQKEIALRARSSNAVEQWKTELEKNREEIRRISGLSLKDIMWRIPSELVSNDLRNCRILEFLLRSGYINEEYPYYISHFYAGSLLVTEHEFILGVKERKPKAFDYPLTNIPAILKRLYMPDYSEDAVLNIYLLEYLLDNEPENTTNLSSIFQLLSNNKKYSTDFIDQFMKSGKSAAAFVSGLSLHWTGWWDYVQEHPTATDEYKQNCFFLLLKHAGLPQLKAMNGKGMVAGWLAELRKIDIPEDNLKSVLSELSVKVKHVQDESVFTDAVADHLCANNLYEINPEMLDKLLRIKVVNIEQLPPFSTKPYSAIQASGLTTMNEYIDKNMDLFIGQVLLKQQVNLEEPEGVILRITEDPQVSPENKEAIIQKMSLRVSNLGQFDEKLWVLLLKHNKVLPSWSNLSEYTEQGKIVDEELARYLNSYENGLEIVKNFDRENEECIATAQVLLNSPLPSPALYETIASVFPPPMTEVNIHALDLIRIGQLIENELIPFNKDYFGLLKSKSRNLSFPYLVRNKAKLSPGISEWELDAEDYTALLKSDQLIKEQKNGLVPGIPQDLYEFSPLATEAARTIINGSSVQFANRLSIVQYNSEKELSVMMAIQQLQTEPAVIDQMLAVMGDNYALLGQSDQKISFPNNANHKTFFSLLREKGHIARTTTKGDTIVVQTRKTKDKAA
jgi:hypothetical protein